MMPQDNVENETGREEEKEQVIYDIRVGFTLSDLQQLQVVLRRLQDSMEDGLLSYQSERFVTALLLRMSFVDQALNIIYGGIDTHG